MGLGAHWHSPLPGGGCPPNAVGRTDPWGRTVAKRAAFTPRCPPSKVGLSRGTCCPLTLSVLGMPTASSGATGEDATKPAAPWDSSGSVIMHPTEVGGLCAPHLLGRGCQGGRAHAPPPLAARAPVSRGRWPLTLVVPGPLKGARCPPGSQPPPCQSGRTGETLATSHAPRTSLPVRIHLRGWPKP